MEKKLTALTIFNDKLPTLITECIEDKTDQDQIMCYLWRAGKYLDLLEDHVTKRLIEISSSWDKFGNFFHYLMNCMISIIIIGLQQTRWDL